MDIYKCPKLEKARGLPEKTHRGSLVTIMLTKPLLTRFICDDTFLTIFLKTI